MLSSLIGHCHIYDVMSKVIGGERGINKQRNLEEGQLERNIIRNAARG